LDHSDLTIGNKVDVEQSKTQNTIVHCRSGLGTVLSLVVGKGEEEGEKESLEDEGLGLLPGEDVTPEVTIAGGLLEDWVLELEVLHDTAGTQVKVLLHNLVKLRAGLGSGAIVEDSDRQRLSDTDGVGDLYEDPLAEPSLDE